MKELTIHEQNIKKIIEIIDKFFPNESSNKILILSNEIYENINLGGQI